ncbi:MAG: hypothetical protein JKY56_12520 [Kofleriaceae bacterium]|nr:hypothetical protein [Kofleriaceae bacterium]
MSGTDDEDGRFGPPPEDESSLNLGGGFAMERGERASLTQHKQFIESANKQVGIPVEARRARASDARAASKNTESYSERQYEDRKLYWVVTRVPVLLILGWFTLSHLVYDADWVFIDGVNLLIHEGGHVIWRFAGDTMWFLGGSLTQVLLPAMMAYYFFSFRREKFAASACLWWVGESFLNVARYMHDAPVEELPLVGGNIHDWKYLFQKWDVFHMARDIADVVHWLGVVLMLGAMAYMVYATLWPNDRQLASGLEYTK